MAEEEEEEENARLPTDSFFSCGFLGRFDVTQRGSVSQVFHKWAKTPAFKDPVALVGKVKGAMHIYIYI